MRLRKVPSCTSSFSAASATEMPGSSSRGVAPMASDAALLRCAARSRDCCARASRSSDVPPNRVVAVAPVTPSAAPICAHVDPLARARSTASTSATSSSQRAASRAAVTRTSGSPPAGRALREQLQVVHAWHPSQSAYCPLASLRAEAARAQRREARRRDSSCRFERRRGA